MVSGGIHIQRLICFALLICFSYCFVLQFLCSFLIFSYHLFSIFSSCVILPISLQLFSSPYQLVVSGQQTCYFLKLHMSYFLRFHTEWMIVYGESLQYVSTQKDSSVECAKGFNPEICTDTDELDHISLKERYRILLADKSSGPVQ